MDEVHFLADRFRGAVGRGDPAPGSAVRVVSLSATVSNAEEFGDWIKTVRGDTTVIVDEHRPVPLSQHVLVGNRMFDLYERSAHGVAKRSARGRSTPISSATSGTRCSPPTTGSPTRAAAAGQRTPRWRHAHRGPMSWRAWTATGCLPGDHVHLLRKGCDGALAQRQRSRLSLLEPHEAARVDEIVDRHVTDIAPADAEVLGVEQWRAGLRRGFLRPPRGLPTFRHAGGGTVRQRSGEGGVVRYRDSRSRYQHARSFGGARTARR